MNHFLKLAYNHGVQQALRELGLSKLGSLGIDDITRKIKIAPVDLSTQLKKLLRGSLGDHVEPFSPLERAALGGLAGGAAGGLASDEDNTLRGAALGAALGASAGGLSGFTRKKIYEGGGHIQRENILGEPYTETAFDRLDDLRHHRALIDDGWYDPNNPADVLNFETRSNAIADSLPLNRMLASAALTGAGTLGAGVLGGRLASED